MRVLTQSQCCRIIVNVMCNGGFMNGWIGDTSPEFRNEQVCNLINMTEEERTEWIERNNFNLTHYCRVPTRVLQWAIKEPKRWV